MATFIFPVSQASIPGVATEATLLSVDTNTASTVTELQTLNATDFATQTTLSALNTKVPSQGAALTAASVPVNIASDQTVPVSAAALPLPTGAATETTLASLAAEDFATQTTLSAVSTALTTFSNKTAGALVPEKYDEIVTTYVGATTKIDTVVYKLATVTVATLTMSYDGSDRLIGVVRT